MDVEIFNKFQQESSWQMMIQRATEYLPLKHFLQNFRKINQLIPCLLGTQNSKANRPKVNPSAISHLKVKPPEEMQFKKNTSRLQFKYYLADWV